MGGAPQPKGAGKGTPQPKEAVKDTPKPKKEASKKSNASGKQEAAPTPVLPQKVWLVDASNFQRLLVPATTAALHDHKCSNYKTALETAKNTRERELEKKSMMC